MANRGRSTAPLQQLATMRYQAGKMAIVAAFLVALALALARSCEGRQRTLIPACFELGGYEAIPGGLVTYTSGGYAPMFGSEGATFNNFNQALLACNRDDNCIGINTDGLTVMRGGFDSVSIEEAPVCQYFKIETGKESGYTLRPYMGWIPDSADTHFVDTESAAAAKKACDENRACTAWTTAGRYAVGAVTTNAFSESPGDTSLYLKQVCPQKYGYTAYAGYSLSGTDGMDGVGYGKMPQGGEGGEGGDAEDFCRLEYRCTGFSSDGSYVIGGVDLVHSGGNICTYVKEPCAPMRGFTSYNDVNIVSSKPPGSRPYLNCFAEVYKACLNNPHCKTFNNVRYMWSDTPSRLQDSDLESAPGTCVYHKLSRS